MVDLLRNSRKAVPPNGRHGLEDGTEKTDSYVVRFSVPSSVLIGGSSFVGSD